MTGNVRPLDTHPGLWEAIGGTIGLRAILEDFYTRVYDDPRLKHFFDGVTKERAIDKQYSFLMQIFTGERVYFGDRPRNAHHWMVISEELFDYREELMAQCLRRHGLSEAYVAEWRAVEEVFRKQIVKSAPQPVKRHGAVFSLGSFESTQLEVATLCDGCQEEIPAGAALVAHSRTGKVYCDACGIPEAAP